MNKDVKKFVMIALYSAMFVVLSIYGTINLTNLKITLQNLPIYIGAITLGSISGASIGFIGMFVSQIITYGFSATTLFWVLPQTILGAVCGIIFESNKVKINNRIKFLVTIIVLQIFLTALNTIVLTIDGMIYGYFNYVVVFTNLIVRIMNSVLTGIVYSILIPIIVKFIKKIH